LTLVLFAVAASAADDGPPREPKDTRLDAARAAIAQKDWARAQALLREALAAHASNADAHNLYAYALRNAPQPDMDLVFRHYHEALRLDPRHRGAHEYIGEAYLMVGNLAKAKEHLQALDRICRFGCKEYTDLRKAIEAYEKRQAAR
jgi:tetratricopeptide (TPR) repeat protein